jgi:hypothetical protein
MFQILVKLVLQVLAVLSSSGILVIFFLPVLQVRNRFCNDSNSVMSSCNLTSSSGNKN